MLRRPILIFLFLLCAARVHGQYYDWGRSPASIRWRSMETAAGELIYPDYFSTGAGRVAGYLGAVRPDITYGLRHDPLRLPVMLHTQNAVSNGIVMWAPKRMEFIAFPNVDTYAEPWLKQLAIHEYRHATQYGNLYQGWIRPIGWFVGQHVGLASNVLVPLWLLEGDATQVETQMSSFGRALQPSFTIEYRAYFDENKDEQYRLDKWFVGSYKDYIPSHYQFGYQVTAWGREKYGDDIWGRVIDFAAHNPYYVFPTNVALRYMYRTNVTEMAKATIRDMKQFWRQEGSGGLRGSAFSGGLRRNSSTIINTPVTSYTRYSAPMNMGDSTLLAMKWDMDRPYRVVGVDVRSGGEDGGEGGGERRVFDMGNVVTPPVTDGAKVYWSEYRGSTLWDQRVAVKAVSYDLATGRRSTMRERDFAMYPTPYRDGEIVSVGYDKQGYYYLERDGGRWLTFPDTISVHGLCYDDHTGRMAFIGLCDGGMYIGEVTGLGSEGTGAAADPGLGEITKPGRVTISGLRAGDGFLSFSSIASGRDEVHIYDLSEGAEYRITNSRYGSASPSAAVRGGGGSGEAGVGAEAGARSSGVAGSGEFGGAEVYFTTYTAGGYRLARQRFDVDSLVPQQYSYLPLDKVNPPRRRWDVTHIDTLSTAALAAAPADARRYRKIPNMFNLHSWAPWAFTPTGVIAEDRIDFGLGATVMSQDLLASTVAYMTYGYTGAGGSRLHGALNYYGLAPKFELGFDWGGGRQLVYGAMQGTALPGLKRRAQISGRVSLPMNIYSGHRTRTLTPAVEMMHMNALLYHADGAGYDRGYQRMLSTLTYMDNARMAVRDILPRNGYAVKLAWVSSPFRDGFSSLFSAFGRVYLPGVMPHNVLTLRANYQYQRQAHYNFMYKELYPRGARYGVAATKYMALSGDYTLPLGYPDWGVNGVVYFKRVRLNLYYDFARMKGMAPGGSGGQGAGGSGSGAVRNVTSYGGEITFDMHLLRIPVNTSSLGVFIYKPDDRSGVVTGVNFSLPL